MSNERDSWTEGEMVERSASREQREGESAMAQALLEMVREQRRSRRWKIFFRFCFWGFWLLVAAAVAWLVISDREAPGASQSVGVVDIRGVIADDAPASAERVIRGLQRAWQGSSTAVVLDINSPGGSPVQSQRIYNEIRRLRALDDKPIIAVIEDIGASGAYYVASAADSIHAAPASLVGSIGVIYAGFGLQNAIERLGVERRVMIAGDNKDMLDPFQPLEPRQVDHWQRLLDETHQQFIDDVREGRGERLGDNPELFSGLIWNGEEALSLGLIDGFDSVPDIARRLTGSSETVDYTVSGDPLERLSRRLGQVAAHYLGIEGYGGTAPIRLQ
ncbi:S49 family peptidase [Kushneria aurantia]|uniref:S49 family peptidase n=1 Tax=Kushneria aurantia TaxID=504092 RepID=A0ABV6G7J7_9GAMM|nr:S49 family peptidase [Kushneria aurantia]